MPDHSDPFADPSHLPAMMFGALVLMTVAFGILG
jgi:hypothetical protein